MSERSVFVLGKPSGRDLIDQINVGRRYCVDCGAILSHYNPSHRFCALHEPGQVARPSV